MTPTHVICPKVDGLPEYLTAGKRYEVNNWREGFVGGAVFVFYDDHGWPKQAVHKNSFYLNGADWIPVYGDDVGNADATQPNWNDPRSIARLVVAWGEIDMFDCNLGSVQQLLDLPVGEHSGDCTKQAHMCARCQRERIEELTDQVMAHVSTRGPNWNDLGPRIYDAAKDVLSWVKAGPGVEELRAIIKEAEDAGAK